jgi:hypothetical protein
MTEYSQARQAIAFTAARSTYRLAREILDDVVETASLDDVRYVVTLANREYLRGQAYENGGHELGVATRRQENALALVRNQFHERRRQVEKLANELETASD